MDGGQGAVQAGRLPQFGQRQSGLLAEQGAHPALVGGDDPRLAPGAVVACRDVAGPAPLLKRGFLTMPKETR